ncbi:MAG: hypothetical protein JXR97_05980 [Planctomycetes bacterium]|nr:hypothetical protein [Planctomycetota bacterium]
MTSIHNQAIANIGIRLGGVSVTPQKAAVHDLEQVFLNAAGEMRQDGRLASLLFSWVHVHSGHVIVEKLRKLLRQNKNDDVNVAISALAAYAVSRGQHKWKKLITPQSKGAYLFCGKVAESAVKLKGAEAWAEEYGILIAKGSVRIRPEDVLTVEELAKANGQYRNRLLFGASWRADIITAIQQGATTATDVMKRVGCSYEPAHRIRMEYLIASQA